MEDLREERHELRETLKNLKETQIQLVQAEKMSSLGQLTAGIAHELNNPINFINSGAIGLEQDVSELMILLDKYKLLGNGNNDSVMEEITKYKKEIDYSFLKKNISQTLADLKIGAIRSAFIVRGLSNFSRADVEDMTLANIHDGLDDTLTLLQNKFKDKVKIVRNYDKNIKEIMCYPGQLNQVFMNLLANAEEAIEKKGEVIISTKNLDKSIQISIKDNGAGMNKETRKQLFDPFFTTKDVGRGIGLGLSISLGIIKKHDGNIKVESESGKGSNFTIVIPNKN